jgi:magnesium chelatase subunit I
VATVAEGYLTHVDPRQVIEWFDLGGSLQLGDTLSAADLVTRAGDVQGLVALAHDAGVPKNTSVPELASGIDFVLEGLYATRRISRSEERGYHAAEPPVRRPTRETAPRDEEQMPPSGSSKKKYYN